MLCGILLLNYNITMLKLQEDSVDLNGGISITLPSISENDEEDAEEENEKDAEKQPLASPQNSPPLLHRSSKLAGVLPKDVPFLNLENTLSR